MITCPICQSDKFRDYKVYHEFGPSVYGIGRLISHTEKVCDECGFVATFQNLNDARKTLVPKGDGQ